MFELLKSLECKLVQSLVLSYLQSISYLFHRCGPCLRIAPAFSSMSNKYPQAVFLEVDVHQCQVRQEGPFKIFLKIYRLA